MKKHVLVACMLMLYSTAMEQGEQIEMRVYIQKNGSETIMYLCPTNDAHQKIKPVRVDITQLTKKKSCARYYLGYFSPAVSFVANLLWLINCCRNMIESAW